MSKPQLISKGVRTLVTLVVCVCGVVGATLAAVSGLLVWFVAEEGRSTKVAELRSCVLLFVVSVLCLVWLGIRKSKLEKNERET